MGNIGSQYNSGPLNGEFPFISQSLLETMSLMCLTEKIVRP